MFGNVRVLDAWMLELHGKEGEIEYTLTRVQNGAISSSKKQFIYWVCEVGHDIQTFSE